MSTPRPPGSDTGGKFASPAASIRSLSQLLQDDGLSPMATAFSSRPTSHPATTAVQRAGGEAQLQSLLAAKEAEAGLLRQQLAQLTADFKFNLRLLEERDAELERADSALSGLKQTATSRDAALQEARRALGDREAALRDKQARVAALEERQRQLAELCDRQVADARASRDEEVSRCRQEVAAAQGEAARGKAEAIADYEQQVSAAVASEREARRRAVALADEGEHVRSQLQRAEARIAEQELSMQRMVSQFEAALATLQQLEGQYDGLVADAGAADQLRAARIGELEREAAALREARAALQQERDAAVAQLSEALAQAEAAATAAQQQHHRAMMDAAELAEALAEARQEAAAQRARAQAGEEAAAEAGAAAAQAQAAHKSEAAAHARTEGLLEAARLHQDAARRSAQEQEQAAARLREAAAGLEAERDDAARSAQAVQAKAQAAEERAQLLAEQLEQERRLHGQLADSREAEVAGRWERALEAAQGERAALQQALELANRQLAAAHRDTETLRLQLQHLRLVEGAALHPHPHARSAGGGSAQTSPGKRAESSWGGADSQAAYAAGPTAALGSVAGSEEAQGSVAGAQWAATSRDVLPELAADPAPGDLQPPEQQQGSRRRVAGPYHQQLHRRVDTLASKLSTFQRAVEEARLVGRQASQQLVESSSMLPAELQRRQEAVADQQLRQALASERQRFDEERRRLDGQLAEQQALLQEREAELVRLRRSEEGQQQRLERERWLAQEQQQQQHELEWQQRRLRDLELAAAAADSQPGLHQRAHATASMQLPVLGAPRAGAMSLVSAGYGLSLPASSPSTSPQQRRSVSAALAAAGSSGPLGTLPTTGAYGSAVPPSGPPQRANGSTVPAARAAALRGAVQGPQQPAPAATGATAVGGSAAEDPLARARRQVLAAKQYLNSVADLGGRPDAGSSGNP